MYVYTCVNYTTVLHMPNMCITGILYMYNICMNMHVQQNHHSVSVNDIGLNSEKLK